MTIKKFLLKILMLCIFSSTAIAQDENNSKRNVGLSATLQGLQFGINIPIWFSESVTIGPSLDFIYAESVGTDFGFGIVSKMYIKDTKVSPYVGIKLGFISNTPDKTILIQQEKTTDLYGGLAFGGEYFFDRQFSISVEIQGNFTKSDTGSYRFGNPDGLNFNTASMVAANIYF